MSLRGEESFELIAVERGVGVIVLMLAFGLLGDCWQHSRMDAFIYFASEMVVKAETEKEETCKGMQGLPYVRSKRCLIHGARENVGLRQAV